MTDPIAIQFDHLSKTFGRGPTVVEAVRNLNLRIATNQVFGFLGPNGAGKSTTIRLLMNLIRPSEGKALIFDRPVAQDPVVLRRVGALVEGAAFYDYLTGRQNLEVLSRTANDLKPERIEQLLEFVGLAARSNQRVSGYSTGMKQRLGLAASLLNDPELVILDEPTNGLDPAGIQEIRALIRTMVDRDGKTVFLSSHLLNEVEQLCDRVAIIHQGQILRHGPVSELLTAENTALRIQAEPVEKAMAILANSWPVARHKDWLEVSASPKEGPAIVAQLVDAGVKIYQLVARHQSLEDYFMAVTREPWPGSQGGNEPANGEVQDD